jgi:IPT/TIG domain
MKDHITRIARVSLLIMTLIQGMISFGQGPVLTQHNDNARTGQNLSETTLNTSNVNQNSFGKLFWRTVDGFIYAQPLYVPSLNIQGATHNVVYVATQHNSVYAFDADNPNSPAPLWQVSLGTSVPSQDICIITGDTSPVDCPYYDISPEIGITSTPVIDRVAGIIYVVARTKNLSNNTYHFFLHALDLISGTEQLAGPVEITGQVSGSGTGAQGGIVAFDATYHLQRPSLLLQNGVIYIAFGSQGDIGTWHGWLMSYNATTLQQEGIFNVTPDGGDGGIWSVGQGLVGDSNGNVYTMIGNGDFNANVAGGINYGDSFVKFSGSSLAVLDYFTPSNQATLNADNDDLGAGGPMLVPGTSLLVGQGKDSIFRVVNSTNMGHFNSSVDNDTQEFTATAGPFFSSPVYWNSPNKGPVVYIWGRTDFLKAFQFTGSSFNTTAISEGTIENSTGFSNAAALSVSASGSLAGSGIVWSSAPLSGKATGVPVPGIVRAFDATDLATELWDSTQNPTRDAVGNYAKFVPPTIANGKVYAASFSGQLQVYGLNPPPFQGVQFVQVASATPQSTTVSVPVAYTGSQTAGDLNVVIVGWNDSAATVQSITDSAGNNYALAIGPTTGTALRQSIYYAPNIVGSNANTVTVTFNQGATKPDVRILEYSGVATSNPLDVSAGASGNSNIADSGFVRTTAANELIVGADMVSSNTTIMAGAPYTIRTITSPNSDLAADYLVNVPGSYHSWAPLNAPGAWVMQGVTFRAAVTSTVPFVNNVSPNSGTVAGGTVVTITGVDFTVGATVTFGGTAATNVAVVNNTTIMATTPAGSAGMVTMTVTIPGGQSGSLTNAFTYIGQPTVSSLSPNNGLTSGGTAVTITGTNFAAGAAVTFGSAAATNVIVVNNTTITATTPMGSTGVVTVTVTNVGSQSGSLANGFTYVVGAPAVSSVSPNNGPVAGGTAVTITGTNFAAGAAVTFGSAAATNVIVVNNTTITATTPVGSAGTVTITVTDVGSQSGSLANGFTYNAPVPISFAQVASATPQSPTATVSVSYPAAQTLGDMNVVVVGWNDTTATVQSVKDSASNTYNLAIGPTSGTALRQSIYYASNIAGGSNTVTVTFNEEAPFPDVRILEYKGVTTLDVVAGASGSSASASSGTATTTGTNDLIFGANIVATTTTAAGSGFTSRLITTPDSDIAEDKIVTTAGSNSATAKLISGPWVMQIVAFSAVSGPAPSVNSVSPNSGSTVGGTPVTITGTNFLAGATVTFGGINATNVAVVNSTTVTVTTPAGSTGAATVAVTNPGGQNASLANAFTYIAPPTVSSITPSSGPVAGGTGVTITGIGFLAGATVTIGGTAATKVVVVNSTTITATTPAGSVGAATVTVTNSGQSGSLANGFTYIGQPTVSSVSPNSGSTLGGTVVTIKGTNFAVGATVTFGGTSATNVIVVNSTMITVTTPARSSGTVSVTVTNVGAQTSTLTNGFTYVVQPTVTSVSPNSGPVAGGTAVTITGTNFATGAAVTFGVTAATNVVVANSTTITATTPAGSIGAVPVTVMVNGQSGSLTSAFTYIGQPTVTSVSPNNGPTAGGIAVTITGTNFATGATVTLGSTVATNVVVVNSTKITATTPAGSAGAVTVTVTNPGGQSGSLASGFTYNATATISFMQVNSSTPQSPTATVTVSYPAAQTQGDLNIVVVGWNDTSATVQSLKDSAGNVYSLAIGPTSGTVLRQSIYYAANIAGGSGNTVTITFSQAAVYPDVRILEYNGVTTLDVVAGASGSSSNANSGTATTTSANELIFGANTVETTTTTAGSSFIKRIITTPDGDIAEDKIVTVVGSNSATATVTSGPWVMQMVAFK